MAAKEGKYPVRTCTLNNPYRMDLQTTNSKRGRSLDRSSQPESKKMMTAAVSTSNSFDLLTDASTEIIIPSGSKAKTTNFRADTEVKQRKTKPVIMLNTSHEQVKRLTSGLGINCVAQKMRTKGGFQLLPKNKKDKEAIIKKLQDSGQPFHTYTEPEDRQNEFVMLNFERQEPELVLKALQNEKIPATRVSFLRDHSEYPIYKVSFAKNTISFHDLNYQHRYVDSLKITWDKLVSRRRPTQCKRCQAWGHSAFNCGRPYRCVKCNEKHLPGKEPDEHLPEEIYCKRNKNDDTPPTCINCNGPHLASSYQCPAFIRYQEKTAARHENQQQRTPREFTSTRAPWATDPSDHLQFPSLAGPSGQSNYPSREINSRQIVNEPRQSRPTENVGTPFHDGRQSVPTLEDLTNEFKSIPDIKEATAILKNLFRQLRNCPTPLAKAQKMLSFMQNE